MCVCGWSAAASSANACGLPAEVCALSPVLDAEEQDQWTSLCASGYSTRKDLLLVLRVLRDSEQSGTAEAWRATCSAATPSATWGLLAPAQQHAWYTGASQPDDGQWKIDAQHLATHGPGGLRIGMLVNNTQLERPGLHERVKAHNMGGAASGSVNFAHGHTVAQPVCESTLSEHLEDTLDNYFEDVFFPPV